MVAVLLATVLTVDGRRDWIVVLILSRRVRWCMVTVVVVVVVVADDDADVVVADDDVCALNGCALGYMLMV